VTGLDNTSKNMSKHVFAAAVVTACIADIAFVIDNSGSIRDNDPVGGNNWQLIINFVKSIINMFTISPDVTRIAVVDFGRCCTQHFCFFPYNITSRLTC